jgi:hypothetical protein
MANERERKQILDQINEALDNSNDLAKNYAALLGEQLDGEKKINDRIKDRSKILNTLMQDEDSLTDKLKKGFNIQVDLFKVNNKLKNSRRADGTFQKGFNVQKIKQLNTDKKILETQKDELNISKMAAGLLSKRLATVTAISSAAVAAKEFGDRVNEIGREFGAIGLLQFRGQLADADAEAIKIGKSLADVSVSINTLTSEFGFTFEQSRNLANSVVDTGVALGLSTDEASKLTGVLVKIGGLSAEAAEKFAKQATLLAVSADVAPQAVLQDIANSAEVVAKFTGDTPENLVKASIQAQKLGTNLSTVGQIAEGLLDFESSITKELEASVLIGRQLNFQRARELALNNDIEGAIANIVGQLGTETEFNKLNLIQRRALADSLGVQVSDIAKFVQNQGKVLTLSQALAGTKGFEELVGPEALKSLDNLINNLKSIGAIIVNDFGPIVEDLTGMLVPVFQAIGKVAKSLSEVKLLLPSVILGFTALKIAAAALAGTGIGGIALAGAGLAASAFALQPAGDMKMKAGNAPIVTTSVGAFQLSPQDDLMAGPGIASGGGGGSSQVVQAINDMKTAFTNELREVKNETKKFNSKELVTSLTNRQISIALTDSNA